MCINFLSTMHGFTNTFYGKTNFVKTSSFHSASNVYIYILFNTRYDHYLNLDRLVWYICSNRVQQLQ